MAGSEAVRTAATALPIISVARLTSASLADRQGVAREIRRACLHNGFFYISDHGIPPSLVADVFRETKKFFALPEEAKERVNKMKSRANRGYEPLGGQTLETGAMPDLKEGFYIGTEIPADHPRAKKFNHGPNQWPAELPAFRAAMQTYREQMVALGVRLFRCLALSLDLSEDYFEGFCADASILVRLLHYPPQRAGDAPDRKGAGAHTDFGGITILLQDDVGGLQVWDQETGGWIHAPPIPGTYVVNLGDMIARWTNDRYRSTLHRVVNESGRERYSIPFFFTGNYDHMVECIPTCLAPDAQPIYPPITVEEHLRACYRRTYK